MFGVPCVGPPSKSEADAAAASLEAGEAGCSRTEEKSAELEVKWLLLLSVETFTLFLFQVFIGFEAGSVALLSDSVHSFLDIVTYSVNWYVEATKFALWKQAIRESPGGVAEGLGPICDQEKSRDGKQKQENQAAAILERMSRIDKASGVLSVLVLLAAMSFVTKDAVDRLMQEDRAKGSSPVGPGAEEKEIEEEVTIGTALFGFALLSTVMNILVMLLSKRWRRDQSLSTDFAAPTSEEDVEEGLLPGPESMPWFVENDSSCADFMCLPCTPRGGEDVSRGFNCSACSTPRSYYVSADNACGEGKKTGEGTKGDWMNDLHALVHPGCQGHSPAAKNVVQAPVQLDMNAGSVEDPLELQLLTEEEEKETGTLSGSWKKLRRELEMATATNFNVAAARLHLMADVFRGISIFICGILIRFHIVHDAVRADSICALLIAALILSGALLLVKGVLESMCGAENSPCSKNRRSHE